MSSNVINWTALFIWYAASFTYGLMVAKWIRGLLRAISIKLLTIIKEGLPL